MRGKQFLKEKKALLSGVAMAVLAFLIPLFASAQSQVTGSFIGGATLDFTYSIMNAVIMVIQSALGMLVFIGATMLNLSIKVMLNFNTIVESIPAINETWRILRDVGFMFFIFIILYNSILYILGMKNDALKVLTNIILVGILINFSMFFTKVMIDASNVVALQFYKSIQVEDVVPNDSLIGSVSNNIELFKSTLDGGVGFAIMQALRLPSLYDPSGIEKGGAGISSVRVLVALVMSCIVMFITAGVLLAAGFMFIVRIGILLILLIFSPIPFLALVMDKLKGEATRWWSTLIDQLVFPPVFLCILYITLRIANSPGYKQLIFANNPTFSNIWFAGTAEAMFGGIMVILNYAIIIIFLGIAMKSANQFGGDAAAIGLQYANKVKAWGKSQAASTTSWAKRQTVGRLAEGASKSNFVRDFAASSNPVIGTMGKMVFKGLKSTGSEYKSNIEKQAEEKAKFAKDLGFNTKRVQERQLAADQQTNDLARLQSLDAQLKLYKYGSTAYNDIDKKRQDANLEMDKKYGDLLKLAGDRHVLADGKLILAQSELASAQASGAPAAEVQNLSFKVNEAQREKDAAQKATVSASIGNYVPTLEYLSKTTKDSVDAIKEERIKSYKARLEKMGPSVYNLWVAGESNPEAAEKLTIEQLKKKKDKLDEKLKDVEKDIKGLKTKISNAGASVTPTQASDMTRLQEQKVALTEQSNKVKSDLRAYKEYD